MAAYAAFTLDDLCTQSTEEVLNKLLKSDSVSGFTQVSHDQIRAWNFQVNYLHDLAKQMINHDPMLGACGIVLEYRIPRREKRVDAVLLFRGTIVLIEFKVGGRVATADGIMQLSDYALDLSYYHAESHGKRLIPILCPTELNGAKKITAGIDSPLKEIYCAGANEMARMILDIANDEIHDGHRPISPDVWASSAYRPIPGIIEATCQLFSKHDVQDIKASLAEQDAIQRTIDCVEEAVSIARRERKKILCIVTGVPGAGKTLTGLRIVHSRELAKADWKTVFLSGNGPLLKVLKEALARDYAQHQGCNLVAARSHANALLHSVHSYLAESMKFTRPPAEQVVIFDEAQRAWDGQKMLKMAKRQQKMSGQVEEKLMSEDCGSEPSQIMSILDRHNDGAVVVALCGNGQEIHDGEAGVSEWVAAKEKYYPSWLVRCSPVAAGLLSPELKKSKLNIESGLHLDVPLRAHRATGHSVWVDALLMGDPDNARKHINQLDFPILLSRDLEKAREWLQINTLGTRRYGMLASSGSSRLRPYGIEVSADFRKSIDYAAWFTAPLGDLRASYALEVAATEFECQGLELDRTCVCWCWDLLLSSKSVTPQTFRGVKWAQIKPGRDREYIINKYRVLLTRAREGMIIWVPKGVSYDETRSPKEANAAADYLLSCGVKALD